MGVRSLSLTGCVASLLLACADDPAGFVARDGGAVDALAVDDRAVTRDAIAVPDRGAEDLGRINACTQVDLLFVIDNSGSMADNQRSLIASFPGFIQGVRDRLRFASNYHIGVVPSDDYYGTRAGCEGIGSLVTQTTGPESSRRVCGPFASGGAYLTEAEPDLTARFACAAQVGVGGSDDERMMRALLNAVRPAINAPGACNEGFARRGSLLVVVLISDEDDVPDGCDGTRCMSNASGGTPDDWVRELVTARGGMSDNIVVLSLIGRRADNPCGAVPAARLLGFTRRFGDNGFVGDVCSSDYSAFFRDALGVIEGACARFVAPP